MNSHLAFYEILDIGTARSSCINDIKWPCFLLIPAETRRNHFVIDLVALAPVQFLYS